MVRVDGVTYKCREVVWTIKEEGTCRNKEEEVMRRRGWGLRHK